MAKIRKHVNDKAAGLKSTMVLSQSQVPLIRSYYDSNKGSLAHKINYLYDYMIKYVENVAAIGKKIEGAPSLKELKSTFAELTAPSKMANLQALAEVEYEKFIVTNTMFTSAEVTFGLGSLEKYTGGTHNQANALKISCKAVKSKGSPKNKLVNQFITFLDINGSMRDDLDSVKTVLKNTFVTVFGSSKFKAPTPSLWTFNKDELVDKKIEKMSIAEVKSVIDGLATSIGTAGIKKKVSVFGADTDEFKTKV